jgi:hypothetical protein
MSRPDRALPSVKGPPVPIGQRGWVGPRAGLDTEARGKILLPLPGIEPRSPSRPAHSQTPYNIPVHNFRALYLFIHASCSYF